MDEATHNSRICFEGCMYRTATSTRLLFLGPGWGFLVWAPLFERGLDDNIFARLLRT